MTIPRHPPHPVVLVGGRSTRFGRDKLAHPWRTGLLVDAPIAALREALGTPVALVGPCHPAIASRADLHIPDRYPALGPLGGILSALEHFHADILCLAGDLPLIHARHLLPILHAAQDHPHALAVMARTDRPHPCCALYRPAAIPILHDRRLAGRLSLHDAFSTPHLLLVDSCHTALRNVNTPEDLRDLAAAPHDDPPQDHP